jgi:hypothetical protein
MPDRRKSEVHHRIPDLAAVAGRKIPTLRSQTSYYPSNLSTLARNQSRKIWQRADLPRHLELLVLKDTIFAGKVTRSPLLPELQRRNGPRLNYCSLGSTIRGLLAKLSNNSTWCPRLGIFAHESMCLHSLSIAV